MGDSCTIALMVRLWELNQCFSGFVVGTVYFPFITAGLQCFSDEACGVKLMTLKFVVSKEKSNENK